MHSGGSAADDVSSTHNAMWREISQLQHEVALLKARNRRVGLDKAWSDSLSRKLLIAAATYASLGVYMAAIGIKDPWLNAIVPTVGYVLSTWSFPAARNAWVRLHIAFNLDNSSSSSSSSSSRSNNNGAVGALAGVGGAPGMSGDEASTARGGGTATAAASSAAAADSTSASSASSSSAKVAPNTPQNEAAEKVLAIRRATAGTEV